MLKQLSILLSGLLLSACANEADWQSVPGFDMDGPNIVPHPLSLDRAGGAILIEREVNLITDANAPDSAEAIRSLLTTLQITESGAAKVTIRLMLDDSIEVGREGYHLKIDSDIVMRAPTDTGLFYAVQTLWQMLPAHAQDRYALHRLTIVDEPQYEWRGSMIDVARNFFELDYLREHVERMARFKLNRLHLHLTDDQGWRFEIKSWPKLAEVGGSTQVGGGGGGYYSQEQMRDFVNFARRHQVEVVPEIDLPGHTQAAIAAYPELACDNVIKSPPQNQCLDIVGQSRLELYEGTCVGFSALCASQKPDLVYKFVEDVLREVAEIFPFEYLHIGGDEVLNEEADAFPDFISRTDRIVEKLGRKLLAWEEASAGEIRSNSLLQFWNDDYPIESALDKGIHLVLSPCSYTYLDHGNYEGQEGVYAWCREEGIPLERVYSFTPESYRQVVGVEAPMWSEVVPDRSTADNRMWPRLAAIAEISWTPKNLRDYDSFKERLATLREHLNSLGVHYYRAPELGWDE